MINWPKHEAEMTISHNPHKSMYQTIEEWEKYQCHGDEGAWFDWASTEERVKAIETDNIWTLQWYPHTPVGFLAVAASTFEAVIEAAHREGGL